jgi:hypothetical protein
VRDKWYIQYRREAAKLPRYNRLKDQRIMI